jgi:hypothetical protein
MNNIFDYSHLSDFEKSQLPDGFKGNVYNMSYRWKNIIPVTEGPIKFLEIGAYLGANVCSLMKTYAKNKDTEIHVIDPWINYDYYIEYRNEQTTNYSLFIQNISKLSPGDLQKIHIHRGFSQHIVPTFKDGEFDMIYIDGNHATEYVLEDGIHAIRKLKSGGWLIFDDFHLEDTRKGIDSFIRVFGSYFENPIINPGVDTSIQLFMRKK